MAAASGRCDPTFALVPSFFRNVLPTLLPLVQVLLSNFKGIESDAKGERTPELSQCIFVQAYTKVSAPFLRSCFKWPTPPTLVPGFSRSCALSHPPPFASSETRARRR